MNKKYIKKYFHLLALFLLLILSCKNKQNLSDNAYLKELKIEGATLTPEFNPEICEYIAQFDMMQSSTEIIALPQDSGAKVKIEEIADRVIIKVIAQNGHSNINYTVRLKKDSLIDLGLASLSVFANTKKLEFTEAFQKQKTHYLVNVPYTIADELNLLYKTKEKTATVSIQKTPETLQAEAGSIQTFTLTVHSEKYMFSKTYFIKCIRQALDSNTNIKNIKVFGTEAIYNNGEFIANVPLKASQKEIEKNIIALSESNITTVAITEENTAPFVNTEGATKKYIIKITAEDASKQTNYILKLTRKKEAEVNIKAVFLSGTPATQNANGSFSFFVPYNFEATKIDTEIQVQFEEGEEYSYRIEAKNRTPLQSEPFSYKEYEIVVFLGTERVSKLLSIYRDVQTPTDRSLSQVLTEKITFTGKKPSWLDSSNPDYQDLLGVFKEGQPINIEPFAISPYEVTFELWMGVYRWASKHGYYFENRGKCGSSNTGEKRQPVSDISWRDSIVWCNAYSEMLGREWVYYTNQSCTIPHKTSVTDYEHSNKHIETAGSIDMPYIKKDANGFRLPFSNEWEFAARGGDPENELHWNFKYAGSDDASDVAVWFKGEDKSKSTATVASKVANRLGLYDMSGNVFEWCADTLTDGTNYFKAIRGGAYYSHPSTLYVTFGRGVADSHKHYNNRGLRVASNIAQISK